MIFALLVIESWLQIFSNHKHQTFMTFSFIDQRNNQNSKFISLNDIIFNNNKTYISTMMKIWITIKFRFFCDCLL